MPLGSAPLVPPSQRCPAPPLEPALVNGQPGLLTLGPAGELLGVLGIDFDDEGRVVMLRNQINPDKLRHLGRVGDLNALMRGE